jgi:hypothetical protein
VTRIRNVILSFAAEAIREIFERQARQQAPA